MRHYFYLINKKNHDIINIMPKTKVCSKCYKRKKIEKFPYLNKALGKKDNQCKECKREASRKWAKKNPEKNKKKTRDWQKKNREKERKRIRDWHRKNPEAAKKWRKNNPEKFRESQLKSKYGITLNDVNEMKIKQSNCCAICKEEFVKNKKINVDHCHKTGKVRGLLCHSCNTSLGKFKDSVEILNNAIKYLKKAS